MAVNLETEHWEHFYIKNLKVGIISVFTTYNQRKDKFISQFKMVFKIEGQVTNYTNKIIYTPFGNRIEWTENTFSDAGIQKKLTIKDGKLKVDNEIINSEIPKNCIPDFAYYVLLAKLDFESKGKYDFTYIDSKTSKFIPNSAFELISIDNLTFW